MIEIENIVYMDYVDEKPKKKKKVKSDPLPWPRTASDNDQIQVGVDVIAKRKDIIKLVHKFFHVDGISMEELLQEVYVAILHKNKTRSAHDPRKSSFGHYVYMVANNVCINLVHKKRRYDKERDSIYEAIGDDEKPVSETAEAEDTSQEYESENVEALEEHLRKKGKYELARYVRAVRTGASPETLREALSFGAYDVNLKAMREIRREVQNFVKVNGI
jgi:DNA-directed RNA polymerase specialized sigma24 family protein